MPADIADRDDLDLLVTTFYRDVVTDDLLGPYFVGVDLTTHLPKLVDYWETLLFGTGRFDRPAMPAHLALHQAAPFHHEHFVRWLALFDAVVDDHFAGPTADRAKSKARSVLRAIRHRTVGHGIELRAERPGTGSRNRTSSSTAGATAPTTAGTAVGPATPDAFDPDARDYLDAVAEAPTLTVPLSVTVDGGEATVWAKLEFQLPSGSTKDRIAAHILRRAIDDGRLTPASTVIEASSGSTSISFAMLCARLGLPFVAVMPEGVSNERLLIIRRYGGDWQLTPADEGVPGAIAHVERRAAAEASVFWPDQFHNPANAEVHDLVTGHQLIATIEAETGSAPDGFVAAVGTAGSLMGTGRALRRRAPDAVIARVRLSGAADAEQGGVPCGIPGVVDCLSGLLDPAAIGLGDEIVITRAAAMDATRRLCRLGFPVGPSSGLNFAGAVALARHLGPDSSVATVFCDRMERYFSTDLFDDVEVEDGRG